MATETKTNKEPIKITKFSPGAYPNMSHEMKLVVRDFSNMIRDDRLPFHQRVYFNSMLELILSGAMDYESALIQARHDGYSDGLNVAHGEMADDE